MAAVFIESMAAPEAIAHGRSQALCGSHVSDFVTPRLTLVLSNAHGRQNLKAWRRTIV